MPSDTTQRADSHATGALEPPKLGRGETFITEELARSLLPVRTVGAHKWGVGGVVIVAGAPQYVGAVSLCARSAGRSGAGIVSLAVPRPLVGVIAGLVPEATFVMLGETESVAGARRAIDDLRERVEKSRALVIGPGLGDDEAATGLLDALFGVHQAGPAGFRGSLGFAPRPAADNGNTGQDAEEAPIRAFDRPIVLDADGLNWLAKQDGWPALLPPGRCVLTPHPGELSRLLDKPAESITDAPIEAAREAARRSGQVVVFKYGHTVVTDGETARVADDAPPSLATAGSGDTLAGSIGAFLAQGLSPLDAATLAVFAGARAARIAERRFGTLGVVAGDLADAIAETLAGLEK